jgi:hypothetical protein
MLMFGGFALFNFNTGFTACENVQDDAFLSNNITALLTLQQWLVSE